MADHVRTQIRDAAVDALDALTTTSTRCFAARPGTRPLQDSDLPCLIVYTNDESSEAVSGQMATRRLERRLELMVRGYAKGTGDIDKTLDTICAEVETALAADPTLGGKAKDLVLDSTAKEDDEDVEQPTWRVTMRWLAEYSTREAAPTAALA